MIFDESQEDKLKTLINLKNFASQKINNKAYYCGGFVRNVILRLDDSSNYFTSPQTLIYGDFNGLGALNDEHGREEGTKCLHKSLEIIQNILPSNTIFSRVGGDEFLFVIPNSNPKEINISKYIKEIQDSLSHSDISKNLTIELAGATSDSPHQLTNIFSDLQKQVEKKKSERILSHNIETSSNNWDALNKICKESFESFFKTFRLPTNYSVSISEVKDMHNLFMKLYSQNTNKKKSPQSNFVEKTIDSKSFYNNFDISEEQLELLYTLLTAQSNSNNLTENLNSLDDDLLEQLLNTWSRNSLTQSFNRNCLENNFIPFLDKNSTKYKACYLSLSGIKLNNDTSGHEATDEEIKKCADEIKRMLSATLHKPFGDDPENQSNKLSYFFDLDGGNFLGLIKKDKFISKETNTQELDPLDKKLEPALNRYNKSKNFKLPIASYCSNLPTDINTDSFNKFIESLETKCNERKVNIKKDLVNDELSGKLLNSIYENLFSVYEKLIENPDSPESKSHFEKIVFSSALNELASNTPFYKMKYYNEPDNLNLSTEDNIRNKKQKLANIEESKKMQENNDIDR